MEHPAPEAIQPLVLLRMGEVVVAVVVLAIPCIPHLEACVPRAAVVLRMVAVENEADPHMAAPGDTQEVGRSCFLAFLWLGLASRDQKESIGNQGEIQNVLQFDLLSATRMSYGHGVRAGGNTILWFREP